MSRRRGCRGEEEVEEKRRSIKRSRGVDGSDLAASRPGATTTLPRAVTRLTAACELLCLGLAIEKPSWVYGIREQLPSSGSPPCAWDFPLFWPGAVTLETTPPPSLTCHRVDLLSKCHPTRQTPLAPLLLIHHKDRHACHVTERGLPGW
jgi:hypothetical protein